MALEQELETFEAKLPELRAAHEGEVGLHTPFLVSWVAPAQQVALVSPQVVSLEEPDDIREEQLEELRAQICREHGDPRTYVLKVLGMFPPSSPQA